MLRKLSKRRRPQRKQRKKGLVLRFDSAALFTVYLRRLVVAYRFILPLLLIASAYPATAGGLLETWTAARPTASSLTGDVLFSGDKLTFRSDERRVGTEWGRT